MFKESESGLVICGHSLGAGVAALLALVREPSRLQGFKLMYPIDVG